MLPCVLPDCCQPLQSRHVSAHTLLRQLPSWFSVLKPSWFLVLGSTVGLVQIAANHFRHVSAHTKHVLPKPFKHSPIEGCFKLLARRDQNFPEQYDSNTNAIAMPKKHVGALLTSNCMHGMMGPRTKSQGTNAVDVIQAMDRRVRRVCSSLQQHDNICRLLEPRRSCLRHHGRFRLVAARRCVPVYGLLQQRVMTHDKHLQICACLVLRCEVCE